MGNKIDLAKLFSDSLCSFEVAKKAKQAGMTCANTFYAFDSTGEVTDGAWLEKITGAEMYPAINLPLAIGMLENTDLKFDKIDVSETDGKYSLCYEDEIYESTKLIDIFVEVWIKHRYIDKEIFEDL